MGRKRLTPTPNGDARAGPRALEDFLDAARPECLDLGATPLPDEPAAESALPRILTTLLLDVSHSMCTRGALAAVTCALPRFRQSIVNDSLTARKLSWAVLTYAETPTLIRDYGPIGDWQPPAKLASHSWTATGTAIIEMFRLQDEHVAQLAARGVPIQARFCFHVTDGEPNYERPERLEEAARRIEQAEESGTFSFFNIAVEGANLEVLKRLTPRRTPLRLADVTDFSRFFAWLNASLRTTSHSLPGERVPLPSPLKGAENPIGWGQI